MELLIEFASDYLIYVVFVGFAGYVMYSMFTKQGKGRMLGGTIIETTKEEINQQTGMLTTVIRTHLIESKSQQKLVGIEISENAKLGASFKPITLNKSEAQKFVRMINDVISKT